jgi:hypothetical protein
MEFFVAEAIGKVIWFQFHNIGPCACGSKARMLIPPTTTLIFTNR